MRSFTSGFLLCLFFSVYANICKAQNVDWWLTASDQSALFAKQASALSFGASRGGDTLTTINVDPLKKYQSIDGFGFALTGGSAQLIVAMSAPERKKLLEGLFSTKGGGIGISYLRLSIGSSDMNDHVFSYDDLPPGQTDVNLQKFDLNDDKKDVIPVLKEILTINPNIKIMGSPWSAPVWMKTNGDIKGGKLKEEYYPVYAKYFVKYITQMKQNSINIDAVTIQNEPFNDGNTPSMQMFAKEELRFIKDNLGPLFKTSGIKTKIILFDHNCDAPEYSIAILDDPGAKKYIDGSGFHLYAGKITALSKVHDTFPDRNLYFTEQMVTSTRGFNVVAPVERILIGATRNWSRNVILWNLAADPQFKPHTDNGGCPSCQGAITIAGDKVDKNIAYYVVAHASTFVKPNSVRVESTESDVLPNVAFTTPDGKTVLIMANKAKTDKSFNIVYKGKTITPSLKTGTVATYVW
jgi:glucosylceramidase